MSIIVLGQSGQLASHLRFLMPEAEFWGRERLDISDARGLEAALLDSRPTAIINAAAYTAVDRAESEPALAWRINAEAPAAAASAAAALDIPLIHISTDYVFDGRGSEPYSEDSPVNPLNTYGRTKLAGELAVSSISPRHWILRTSWVFSEHGRNFVKTMIGLAPQHDTLRVVADQFGRPTYAGDLAQLVVALMEIVTNSNTLSPGIYHAVGGRATSWHGFAETVFAEALARNLIDRQPRVLPISSADYPTAAIPIPSAKWGPGYGESLGTSCLKMGLQMRPIISDPSINPPAACLI
jgi:dTDP-4-dehydrorhamnose reductase